MKELLEIGNLAQNSGGLLLLLVIIWMDMRALKSTVNDMKKEHSKHEEKYVHTERRSCN